MQEGASVNANSLAAFHMDFASVRHYHNCSDEQNTVQVKQLEEAIYTHTHIHTYSA